MTINFVAKAAILGALGSTVLMGGSTVAGASAPTAKADGCFSVSAPFVNIGNCGYGFGYGHPGYGYYPPIYYPPPPIFIPPPPPPPPPPLPPPPFYPVGYGCGCW